MLQESSLELEKCFRVCTRPGCIRVTRARPSPCLLESGSVGTPARDGSDSSIVDLEGPRNTVKTVTAKRRKKKLHTAYSVVEIE